MYKHRLILIITAFAFVAAGCDIFGTATPAGLVKTQNGGEDWQFINKIKDSPKGTLAGISISNMASDPVRKDIIYASSYNYGLFKSEDAGVSWAQILTKISVYDFVIDPNDSNNIFVAGTFADHGKILASHDNGKSWEEIFNEASSQNVVRSIAANPQNTKELIAGLTNGGIVKSIDGGVSWKAVNNYNDRINKIRWQPSALYILFRSKGLFKSTDGGESFYDNNSSLKSNPSFYQSVTLSANTNSFNQFVISPLNPNIIFVTSANGLYKSIDAGGTWIKLPVPVQQDNAVIRAIAISPRDDNIVYTSAGATIYKTTDGGLHWKTQSVTTNGFVNALLVDSNLPAVAYGGIYILR